MTSVSDCAQLMTAWRNTLSPYVQSYIPLNYVTSTLATLAYNYANSRITKPRAKIACAAVLYHAFQHGFVPKKLFYLGTQKELSQQFNTSVMNIARHWCNLEAWLADGIFDEQARTN